MENFYYECLYDVLRDTTPHIAKSAVLKQLKAKSARLYPSRVQGVMIENEDQNMLLGKNPSLFHLLKMRKRGEARVIHKCRMGMGGPRRQHKA
jgi:hypothetical protein